MTAADEKVDLLVEIQWRRRHRHLGSSKRKPASVTIKGEAVCPVLKMMYEKEEVFGFMFSGHEDPGDPHHP